MRVVPRAHYSVVSLQLGKERFARFGLTIVDALHCVPRLTINACVRRDWLAVVSNVKNASLDVTARRSVAVRNGYCDRFRAIRVWIAFLNSHGYGRWLSMRAVRTTACKQATQDASLHHLTRHKISDRARERAWPRAGRVNKAKVTHRSWARFAGSPSQTFGWRAAQMKT